jgi:RNA polymerase subunit RPABC4/transcription elongation factor Spt4
LLIRPSKTLFEKYYEEVQFDENEDFSLDEENEEFTKNSISNDSLENTLKCPNCSYPINAEFKFCPHCRQELKKDCISCFKELKPDWTVCPYCGKNQEEKVENILNTSEVNKKLELEDKIIKE